MNYYGRRMATCSSDKTIKVWDVSLDSSTTLTSVLKGHEAAVWQISWAHPKFGNYIASSSYDRKVLIWKEVNKNDWKMVYDYSGHDQSVNSVGWAPPDFGLVLACGSSDGNISVLNHQGGDKFAPLEKFKAHDQGVNAISWAPVNTPNAIMRLASAGCDNKVKIWRYSENERKWRLEAELSEHRDWVRDVAWAPSIGLPTTTVASCSQDGKVIIWTQDEQNPFKLQHVIDIEDVVWRVSWSITGNILAVSGGNNVVSLWKENKDGKWHQVYSMDETGQLKNQ